MVEMPVIVTSNMMDSLMYNALSQAVKKVNEEKGKNYIVSILPELFRSPNIIVEVPLESSIAVDPFITIDSERKTVYSWNFIDHVDNKKNKELDIEYEQWFNNKDERDSYISTLNEAVLNHMRKVYDEYEK